MGMCRCFAISWKVSCSTALSRTIAASVWERLESISRTVVSVFCNGCGGAMLYALAERAARARLCFLIKVKIRYRAMPIIQVENRLHPWNCLILRMAASMDSAMISSLSCALMRSFFSRRTKRSNLLWAEGNMAVNGCVFPVRYSRQSMKSCKCAARLMRGFFFMYVSSRLRFSSDERI